MISKKELTVKKIRKRNGQIVDFTSERISAAIYSAAVAVGGSNRTRAKDLTEQVVKRLEKIYDGHTIPTVEQISDCVEKTLIENGHAKTAKAYILYRSSRTRARRSQSTWVDVQKTIDGYLGREDWRVKENSNTDYSFSGLMLYTAGTIIANYVLSEIYPDQIASAHMDGYIHIHDLSNGVIGYCAGWSLKNLLIKGFGNVPNKSDSKPAKHLDVVVSQMVNFLGVAQMEFAGAQAFSSVDTLLAPFVRTDNLSYREVKQNIQRLLFGLNVPSRWGSQTPFTNLTFDLVAPQDMKDDPVIVGGEEQNFTYGDCQTEMDMINRAFLELYEEGDAKGRIFTFPIPTYNLTKNFNWDNEIANLLFRVTAKYGIPYFQNYLGSNLDPKSIRAMCCRLNLDTTQLMKRPGSIWGPGDSTGSIGVVTININRLAYEAFSKDEFFKKLSEFMTLAKDSLEIKRKLISNNLKKGLMPYTRVYLGSFNNYFSTVGLCGVNEACLNLLGKDISSEEGKVFTIEILSFMQKELNRFQRKTGSLYNLEATPAESTAYRLARLDKRMHPSIITSGTEDTPYLTNSSQLPVSATTDLWEALEHQNEIQPLYTGGTMFHTFLGESILDPEACKTLVRKIAENTRLPYFSITPSFSICPNHGYLRGQNENCPECDSVCEIYSRIVGYFRPVSNWNIGKKQEFKDRKTFDFDTSPKIDSTNRIGSENDSIHTNHREKLTEISHKKLQDITIAKSSDSYILFTSANCPRCPSVKNFLKTKSKISGEEIDAFSERGQKLAKRYQVSSTPTVIFLSPTKDIIHKAYNVNELKMCL